MTHGVIVMAPGMPAGGTHIVPAIVMRQGKLEREVRSRAVRRQVDKNKMKHHPAMDMGQAMDGVVVWQCGEEAVEAEARQ
jgi:hypothetical protein